MSTTESNYKNQINIAERKLDFSSEFKLGEKEYQEINSISYINVLKVYLVVFIIGLAVIACQLFCRSDYITTLVTLMIMIVAFVSIYINEPKSIKKRSKIAYSAQGSSDISNNVYFCDKIIVSSELIVPKEYKYEDVISLIETNLLYILRMPYNTCTIVDKISLSGGTQEEFVEYIFSKCINIKKKKVKKIVVYKKICFAMAILAVVILIIFFLAMFIYAAKIILG